MPAAGCCGPSDRITGASAASPRSRRSRRWRARSPAASRCRWASPPRSMRTRAACCRPRCAWSRSRATTRGCATSGPTFVVNDRGGVRGVDWQFNAWGGLDGGLYFPWDKDDAVAQKVLEIEGRDRYRAPFVLEGGAIHVDGQGTLITTEECLLNRNRNPGLTRDADRGPAAALPERRGHRVARPRRAPRRDRRPRRQPLRLREARRGGADLDRRPPRPAVRDLARCATSG